MPATPDTLLALDVGDKRVGIAVASLVARLPRVLTTLNRGEDFLPALHRIIEAEGAGGLVVGLPRGLDGQSTRQTATTEQFAEELRSATGLPVYFQDEALTSQKAESELSNRGKPVSKGDIDALAAVYILEDYLTDSATKRSKEAV